MLKRKKIDHVNILVSDVEISSGLVEKQKMPVDRSCPEFRVPSDEIKSGVHEVLKVMLPDFSQGSVSTEGPLGIHEGIHVELTGTEKKLHTLTEGPEQLKLQSKMKAILPEKYLQPLADANKLSKKTLLRGSEGNVRTEESLKIHGIDTNVPDVEMQGNVTEMVPEVLGVSLDVSLPKDNIIGQCNRTSGMSSSEFAERSDETILLKTVQASETMFSHICKQSTPVTDASGIDKCGYAYMPELKVPLTDSIQSPTKAGTDFDMKSDKKLCSVELPEGTSIAAEISMVEHRKQQYESFMPNMTELPKKSVSYGSKGSISIGEPLTAPTGNGIKLSETSANIKVGLDSLEKADLEWDFLSPEKGAHPQKHDERKQLNLIVKKKTILSMQFRVHCPQESRMLTYQKVSKQSLVLLFLSMVRKQKVGSCQKWLSSLRRYSLVAVKQTSLLMCQYLRKAVTNMFLLRGHPLKIAPNFQGNRE